MGNTHSMVINNVCEIVGGHTVSLDENIVVKLGAIHINAAVDYIVKACFAVFGNILTDHIGLSGGEPALDLFLGKVQTVLIVFECLSPCFGSGTALIELLLGAEAVISLSAFNKLLGIGKIHILALALDIGAVISADIGSLVPIDTGKMQTGINLIDRTLDITSLIRILDAEHEDTVVFLCKKVCIERGAKPSDVEITGGTRRKSCAYSHFIFPF